MDTTGATPAAPVPGLHASGILHSPVHKPAMVAAGAVPVPLGQAAGNVVTGNVATAADLQRLKEEILLGLRQALAEALARIRQQQQQGRWCLWKVWAMRCWASLRLFGHRSSEAMTFSAC